MKRLYVLLMSGLIGFSFAMNDTCEVEEPSDETVYSLAINSALPDLIYGKDGGQVTGFFPDLMRFICNIMGKKCVYIVPIDVQLCWNKEKLSQALNNRWWDVCVGFFLTAERRASLGYVGEMVKELDNYIYVRKGSEITSLQDIKDSNNEIGFVNGFYTNHVCLEKYLGISLDGRINTEHFYQEDIANAVHTGELEAMFMPGPNVPDESRFVRLNKEPIRCVLAGLSSMLRKDMVHRYAWVDEGLEKLKQNGDYQWLCKTAVHRGSQIRCFD